MHFRVPKPLHGWREFAGEVGIIVVGVLIALGAEQVVEMAHWRAEVREFRTAENAELAHNLAAFRYRLIQGNCVARRIADLQRWEDSSRVGKTEPLHTEIGRPSLIVFRTSVWSARDDALSHMPLALRLNYSDLYDLLDNASQQITAEREAWRNLAAFNAADPLSAEDRRRLSELLYRAKSIDWVLRSNWRVIHTDAEQLGIKPDFGADKLFIPPPNPDFCKPLLVSEKSPAGTS